MLALRSSHDKHLQTRRAGTHLGHALCLVEHVVRQAPDGSAAEHAHTWPPSQAQILVFDRQQGMLERRCICMCVFRKLGSHASFCCSTCSRHRAGQTCAALMPVRSTTAAQHEHYGAHLGFVCLVDVLSECCSDLAPQRGAMVVNAALHNPHAF